MTMSTLLLRLSAPMQSWGTETRYDICTTRREPTKSGVLGMIAAAMGCDRASFPERLSTLGFGVRVDREGVHIRDYHTVQAEKSYVTQRYYLGDAVFLVGLEGEKAFLEQIAYSLTHPYFPLYLGRRSCPPAGRIVLGIREGALVDVLSHEPPLSDETIDSAGMRILVDAAPDDMGAGIQRDVALSNEVGKRRYGYRGVKEIRLPNTKTCNHDPMGELEG